MILQEGIVAPNFELNSTSNQRLKLSDFNGKRVVLVFYPADWSPVCGDQIALYNASLKYFHQYQAAVLGISVDSRWCHWAFAQNRKLNFPLLADFEPKGNVARQYGVYNEREGYCERGLFVIDEFGIIQWSYVSPEDINPGADGILKALEKISKN
jgi:peroxiredoxin